MKNSKMRKIGLLIVLLVLVAMTLTACQLNDTVEDKLEKYGLSARITYHANGGFVNDNEVLLSADIYYEEGSKALNLGIDEKEGTLSVKRNNYIFVGWYYPATNSDGSVKYIDKEKDIVELGSAFDFSKYVVTSGDAIDLYAKWTTKQSVLYVLAPETRINNELTYVADGGNSITVSTWNGEDDVLATNENGQLKYVLKEEQFGDYTYINERTTDPLTKKATNYSFVGYYTDAECTQPVTWPIRKTDSEDNIIVYAKYLTSEWTVVKTASEFMKMFNSANINGKYYIKNDIDGTGKDAISVNIYRTFTGVILGNGFKISNFSFVNTSLNNGNAVSIFGSIGNGAKIENITFENCSASYKANTKSKIMVYYFASDIASDAEISDVTINGGEVKIDLRSSESEWLNQAEYCPICKNECDGISVENALTLKILKN